MAEEKTIKFIIIHKFEINKNSSSNKYAMIKANITRTLNKISGKNNTKYLTALANRTFSLNWYIYREMSRCMIVCTCTHVSLCVFGCVCVWVCGLIPQCRSYPDCSLGSWGARCVPVVGTGRKHGWYSSHWTPVSQLNYHNQSSSGLKGQREKRILYTGAHTESSCSLASPSYSSDKCMCRTNLFNLVYSLFSVWSVLHCTNSLRSW